MRRNPRMTAPLNRSITDSPPETLMISFRIISRGSWDRLQGWHEALPGSRIEHVLYGIYVLIVPSGGVKRFLA